MRRVIVSLAVASLMITSACSDEDDLDDLPENVTVGESEEDVGIDLAPSEDVAGEDVAKDVSAPAIETVACENVDPDLEISVVDLDFEPQNPTLSAGEVVRWTQEGDAPHTVTSGRPGESDIGSLFDSGNIVTGDTFCVRFNEPGTIEYFCEIHPNSMLATLEVQ